MKWYKITKMSIALSVCILLSGCSTHKKANKIVDYKNNVVIDSISNKHIVNSVLSIDSLEVTELKWDFYPASDTTMHGGVKSIIARRITKKATSEKSNTIQESSNVKVNDTITLKSNEKTELKSYTPSIAWIMFLVIAVLIMLVIQKKIWIPKK